ncbi:hypothetical protein OPV22_006855 [Ensete ventricosum]|uniref:Uncharacterized protein n=1 Tax=Ensete ventricosum TaxID=4639 RepID=A0AAV8RT95_ENSVE|nr:hypothetical protein OPV22_006855 [Ensete ventricosum]
MVAEPSTRRLFRPPFQDPPPTVQFQEGRYKWGQSWIMDEYSCPCRSCCKNRLDIRENLEYAYTQYIMHLVQ